MSREIHIRCGPLSPKEGRATMKAAMREAQPGDRVTIEMSRGIEEARSQPSAPGGQGTNELAETRVADRLDASLARAHEQAASQSKPANADDYAREVTAAKSEIVNVRTELNKAGIKWTVQGILDSAWEMIVELYEAARQLMP